MKKTKQKIIQTEDSIEALKGLPGNVRKAMVEEGKNVVSDVWKRFLNPNPKSEQQNLQNTQNSRELKPGEEVDLRKKAEKPQLLPIEPGINYAREIIHAEKRIQTQNQHETKVRMQEIIIEIKKLTKSSKELSVQFRDIEKIDHIPANAGKYHENFVAWVLSMIRSAREKVDNTLSWTTALHGKKKQKQYWSLFKKHGTSFGLSSERVVATQVG